MRFGSGHPRHKTQDPRYTGTWLTSGLLPFLILLLAPAGCNQTPENKVVIHIANWGGAGDDDKFALLVRDLERQFEKENPGVEIREENIPQDYVSKMILSFVAGAEPDIM